MANGSTGKGPSETTVSGGGVAETSTKTVTRGSAFPTGWARSLPARALREVVQVAGLTPLVRAEVKVTVHGLEELEGWAGPAVIVANHASHLDTALILTTLPASWRRRTTVAAASDYFFQTWWKAAGSAIAFNTHPLDRRGGGLSQTHQLLSSGWNILIYPEGTRSPDGFVGRFRLGAAMMAVPNGVPVVPVALRGTYAAMPKGRSWPAPGRAPVSVRYGAPIRPEPGETVRSFAPRIAAAVTELLAEDTTTWWQTRREAPEERAALTRPDGAPWRRIWQQSKPPEHGGATTPPRIWR